MINKQVYVGCRQDGFESGAELIALFVLVGMRRDRVDAVLGEVNLVRRRRVRIGLHEPSDETMDVAEGDLRPIVAAELRAKQIRRVGMEGQRPLPTAQLWNQLREKCARRQHLRTVRSQQVS